MQSSKNNSCRRLGVKNGRSNDRSSVALLRTRELRERPPEGVPGVAPVRGVVARADVLERHARFARVSERRADFAAPPRDVGHERLSRDDLKRTTKRRLRSRKTLRRDDRRSCQEAGVLRACLHACSRTTKHLRVSLSRRRRRPRTRQKRRTREKARRDASPRRRDSRREHLVARRAVGFRRNDSGRPVHARDRAEPMLALFANRSRVDVSRQTDDDHGIAAQVVLVLGRILGPEIFCHPILWYCVNMPVPSRSRKPVPGTSNRA